VVKRIVAPCGSAAGRQHPESEHRVLGNDLTMHRLVEVPNRVTALILAAIGAVAAVSYTSAQTPTDPQRSKQMKIKIDSKNFIAVLDDNATAAAFKALLPMKVEMTELNGNEKYARLSGKLPTKDSNPGTIHTGDLMVYGSNTVVLFYKTFPTSYEYTRLGRVKDATGLAESVGSGNVTVTFAVE
jgi:hypothetical protein